MKVVVPFVAGGNTDNQARIVSERLAAVLGQAFVVENRVGAGGAIAAEYVAKAAPDGYTLFFAALNYASAGTGTTTHLTGALFLARAGLKMTHIPYKGGAQGVSDLVGGQVHMYFGNASELIQHSKGGKIRMLGVSSEKRAPQLPDVPAIAESYPGFRSGTWNGYLAPAGTPAPIVEKLAQHVQKIVREPATAARLRSIGVEPLGNTPAEFADFVRKDAPVWRDAVNAAGIKRD